MATNPAILEPTAQEGGDRSGCTLVGVGCPGVERDRRHLEREADDHEDHTHRHQRCRVADPVDALARRDAGQDRLTALAVEQRHAVEHDRGREHAHQEVLHPRFGAAQVALAPAGQHVGGDRQQLEGHEDGDQVARRRHQHHTEDRREHQAVVLVLPVVALGDVVRRQQDDDIPGDEEDRLHDQGEVVDDVGATEHHPVGTIDGEGAYRNQGGEQADAGQHRAEGAAPLEEHHVEQGQQGAEAQQHELGRDRVPVDRRPRELGGELGEHGVSPPPPTPRRRA